MDPQEFYAEAEKIVLFPGSVADLNIVGRTLDPVRYKYYGLMPIEGGKKYLTGGIVPTPAELTEMARTALSGITGIDESELVTRLGAELGLALRISGEFGRSGEFSELAEQLVTRALANPAVMEADIRMKAKKIGAEGLVHVQLYNATPATYMGVPVKAQKYPPPF